MTTLVQIPPSSIPVIDTTTGRMTPIWRAFFEAIVTRAGGINGALQPENAILDAISASTAAGFILQTGASAITKQAAGISATKTTLASVTIQNGVITAWS